MTAVPEMRWYDVQDFGVEGKGWQDVASYFDRLPARAQAKVRPEVWNLSRSATGLTVRFATDAPTLQARWKLRDATLNEPNFPRAGFSGLDLYVRDGARWHWAGATMKFDSQEALDNLVADIPPGPRQCLVHLPLRNPVLKLEIGVPAGCSFAPAAPRRERPIVYYGTSIVHGAYASRPGMVHPAILGRRLERPMLNLGFSGNARMEPEVAELLAEQDPCLYVIDPVPNMHAELITERAEAFMRILLAAHPRVPMVMVEDRSWTNSWLRPNALAGHAASRAAYRRVFERLRDEGAPLFYVPAAGLFGFDDEASPDGSHPTDLGFMRMADLLEPVLRQALAQA